MTCIRPIPIRLSGIMTSNDKISAVNNDTSIKSLPFGEVIPKPNSKSFKVSQDDVSFVKPTNSTTSLKNKINPVVSDENNQVKRVKPSHSNGKLSQPYLGGLVNFHCTASKASSPTNIQSHESPNGVDFTYFESIHNCHKKEEALELNKIPLFDKDSKITQSELCSETRQILLNWLYEVVEVHKISTQTVFLAVHFLDSIIRLIPVKKSYFQLWGCVCLLLATKIEEIQIIQVETLIYMAGSCFTASYVHYCEQFLLMLICQCDLNLTTRYSFAQYYALLTNLTRRESCFYFYLLELSLLDASLCHELPSKVSAAALHLTLQTTRDYHLGYHNHILRTTSHSVDNTESSSVLSFIPSTHSWASGEKLWNDYLVDRIGYQEDDLVSCIQRLHVLHWNTDISSPTSIAKSCKNLIKKYNQRIFYQVSTTILALTFDRLWLGWKHHYERINNRDYDLIRTNNVIQSNDTHQSFISPTSVDDNINHSVVTDTSKTSENNNVNNDTNHEDKSYSNTKVQEKSRTKEASINSNIVSV